MKKIKIFKYFCLIMAFVLSFIFIATSNVAYATETAEKQYSDVMTDLMSNSQFDKSTYDVDESNYNLEIITVAESPEYELFVYVYVPSGDKHGIVATSINISTIHKDVEFMNYDLQLLSKDGVFHKYLVKNFSVLKDTTRYYEISSIFRPYNANFGDSTSSSTNTTSEVGMKSGKSFKLVDKVGGGYDITSDILQLVTITDRYVGFIRYPKVVGSNDASIDVHFIAFSTDSQIDKILEADLTYKTTWVRQSYAYSYKPENEQKPLFRDENQVQPKTIKFQESDMSYQNGFWFSNSYNWKAIEKADEFLQTESGNYIKQLGVLDIGTSVVLKDGAVEDIKKQQWVIRFEKTDYNHTFFNDGMTDYYYDEYTAVSDVSILRLCFKSQGQTFNLGVVDNKTSALPNDPSNDVSQTQTYVQWNEDFLMILKVVLGLIAILVIVQFITPIMTILKPIFKVIVAVVTWIISAPFKLIGLLFKK